MRYLYFLLGSFGGRVWRALTAAKATTTSSSVAMVCPFYLPNLRQHRAQLAALDQFALTQLLSELEQQLLVVVEDAGRYAPHVFVPELVKISVQFWPVAQSGEYDAVGELLCGTAAKCL